MFKVERCSGKHLNVSFISRSASTDAGCSLGLLNGCFGLVCCPSLLIGTAVIADPEIRPSKTLNCSFKHKAAICMLCIIVLFGKSAAWWPMGRRVLKFTVICNRQTCSETPPLSPFKLHFPILFSCCGSVASSSLPSVHRNVRMWTGCYHQCPYLCLAGAAAPLKTGCTRHRHQAGLYGRRQKAANGIRRSTEDIKHNINIFCT